MAGWQQPQSRILGPYITDLQYDGHATTTTVSQCIHHGRGESQPHHEPQVHLFSHSETSLFAQDLTHWPLTAMMLSIAVPGPTSIHPPIHQPLHPSTALPSCWPAGCRLGWSCWRGYPVSTEPTPDLQTVSVVCLDTEDKGVRRVRFAKAEAGQWWDGRWRGHERIRKVTRLALGSAAANDIVIPCQITVQWPNCRVVPLPWSKKSAYSSNAQHIGDSFIGLFHLPGFRLLRVACPSPCSSETNLWRYLMRANLISETGDQRQLFCLSKVRTRY